VEASLLREKVANYAHLFRRGESSKADESRIAADEFRSWSSQPYYVRFIEWLTARIDEPVKMNDQFQLLRGTARANAFKEVKAHLNDLKRRADEVIGE
jgi:hypothetical protein